MIVQLSDESLTVAEPSDESNHEGTEEKAEGHPDTHGDDQKYSSDISH